MYDLKYGKETLSLLKSWIADLSMWDVYNDDVLNEEIFQMKQLAQQMEDKLGNMVALDEQGQVDCSLKSEIL